MPCLPRLNSNLTKNTGMSVGAQSTQQNFRNSFEFGVDISETFCYDTTTQRNRDFDIHCSVFLAQLFRSVSWSHLRGEIFLRTAWTCDNRILKQVRALEPPIARPSYVPLDLSTLLCLWIKGGSANQCGLFSVLANQVAFMFLMFRPFGSLKGSGWAFFFFVMTDSFLRLRSL